MTFPVHSSLESGSEFSVCNLKFSRNICFNQTSLSRHNSAYESDLCSNNQCQNSDLEYSGVTLLPQPILALWQRETSIPVMEGQGQLRSCGTSEERICLHIERNDNKSDRFQGKHLWKDRHQTASRGCLSRGMGPPGTYTFYFIHFCIVWISTMSLFLL